ncbi:IS5 family transposase [Nannocystis punicea]|uniref:IS5 family transposase n=1 Tax=Nannocystis punicea TaxID=2995304 RepID=UPI003530678D
MASSAGLGHVRNPENASFLETSGFLDLVGDMTPRVPRHQLTDDQWNLIADLFPTRNCKTGRRARDRRTILNAIFWVLRTGAPWRDLPIEFGPWSTAWDFFNKWNQDRTFDEVLRRLRSCVVSHDDPPAELWCIDGTSIRAARCSSGGGKIDGPRRTEGSRSGALPGWLGHEDPHPV